METVGIARHQLLRLPSCNGDRIPRSFLQATGNRTVSARPRHLFRRLSVQFSDSAHQQYYVSSKSHTKKKEKDNNSDVKAVKKKLKFMKKLSRDLPSFSLMAYGDESGNSLTDRPKISEAVEILEVQLQQLKSEQKEEKRNMKEKKALMKRNSMKQSKNKCKSESLSSSTSESSDSDSGQTIKTNRLRSNTLHRSEPIGDQKLFEEATLSIPSHQLMELFNSQKILEVANSIPQEKNNEGCSSKIKAEWSSSSIGFDNEQAAIASGIATKRVEICMGGKCKKLGAGALLEEFQRKLGSEGAVMGCKCMGKCKSGPNLRVSDRTDEIQATTMLSSAKPTGRSLCIGVGLQDVDMIVANMLGSPGNTNCSMAAF